jgi:hypothetical protein
LVSARVRRRTDLFPHDLVAFANAGALLSSSLREPPNEEPTHLLVVIDAGLKLSPAREAEAGWQGALATTSAPNVWVLGREPRLRRQRFMVSSSARSPATPAYARRTIVF